MDKNSSEIPVEVRSFLESILQDADMKSLDYDMHEEMLKELYVRLDNFITSAIVENLAPEHLENFIKLNEQKKSREEIESFLKDKIANASEVFQKTFADFRALYLGNVAAARNKPSEEKAVVPEAPPAN